MERNIYGCLEKYEVEFCAADVIKEAYSNKEEFNNDSPYFKFMMSSFVDNSSFVKNSKDLSEQDIERVIEKLNKEARKLIFDDKKK